MTKQELFSEIRRAEGRRDKGIEELQDKCRREISLIKENWAKDNARFKIGDIIIGRHPNYGPVPFTIIRVESLRTEIEEGKVYVSYRGRELHPDFKESYGVSGAPRYESISDKGDVDLLTKPLYTSYIVVTASGKEYPSKSYFGTLETSRSILTSTNEEFVTRYGITEAGDRVEIQKIPNINKYFRR